MDASNELHGHVLEQVLKIGLARLVRHQDRGDPSPVVFPDLTLRVTLSPYGGQNVRSAAGTFVRRPVFEPD